MNIIIFSKDRACQLDLLLNSMSKMLKEYTQCKINTLYTASDTYYEYGYDKLKNIHQRINFINECNFKSDLIENIDSQKQYTVFFVDDIVCKEPFSIDSDELKLMDKDPDILCLSLRLDPQLTYCYAYNTEMNAPNFDNKLRWHWDGMDGDFGYPMSLDGHIFRTKDILPLLSRLKYFNPNSLEGRLSENPIKRNKMICMNMAPIFNTPINKVQTHNTNRFGNISAEYLNKMFLAGYRISLPPLIGFKNSACHQEVDIKLERPFVAMLKNIINIRA